MLCAQMIRRLLHGSWLNLIEGFFSKFARSVLRHIRVTSKHELKQRIMAGIDDVNRHPVIHTWSYKLAEAADNDSNHGNADLGPLGRTLGVVSLETQVNVWIDRRPRCFEK